jgi:hypothetical protein
LHKQAKERAAKAFCSPKKRKEGKTSGTNRGFEADLLCGLQLKLTPLPCQPHRAELKGEII